MFRTIKTLWLRQLKKYWRSKARMLSSLGMPILLLVALGYGFGPTIAKTGGGNYMDFIAPGVVGMAILFASVFNGIELIADRQFGFLKETMVAPVPRSAIMIGRTLGGATTAVAQGLIVLVISMLIGFHDITFGGFLLSLVFMALEAILLTAFGTAVATRMNDMQAYPLMINFIIMPMFFLSSALFPPENFPPLLQFITRINPITYAVDGVRYSLMSTPFPYLGLDFIVLVVLCAIVLGTGTYLFNKMQA